MEQFANRVTGMADRLAATPWRISRLPRPLSVGILRGMGEGLLGSLVLLLLGVLIDQPIPGARFFSDWEARFAMSWVYCGWQFGPPGAFTLRDGASGTYDWLLARPAW